MAVFTADSTPVFPRVDTSNKTPTTIDLQVPTPTLVTGYLSLPIPQVLPSGEYGFGDTNLGGIITPAVVTPTYVNMFSGVIKSLVEPLITSYGGTVSPVKDISVFSLGTFDVLLTTTTYYLTGKDSLGGMVYWSSESAPNLLPSITVPPKVGTLSGVRVVGKTIQ